MLRDRTAELEAQLQRLTAKKDQLEHETQTQTPAPEQPAPEGELAGLRQKLAELTDTAAAVDRELAAREATARAKGEVLAVLQQFDGRCPLAPGLITCSLSGSQVAELAASLQSQTEAASQELTDLRTRAGQLQAQKKTAQGSIGDLEQELARRERARQELRTLAADIERTDQELGQAKQELACWTETPPGGEPDPGTMDSLQQGITRGREILRRLQLAEYGHQQSAQLQQDLQTLQHETAIAEHLVKALGPDGIRKGLLGARLAEFTNQLNDQLAATTEGRCQLAWQDDFTPQVTSHGHTLPLKLLSKSEQLRVGIAVQAAVARMAGLNFLAVDEVDMLDQDNRDLLTGALLTVLDQFHQVLLFCTVGEAPPPNPGLPGVKVFWVQDGTVREIKDGQPPGRTGADEQSE